MPTTYARSGEHHLEPAPVVCFPSVLAVHENPGVLASWCRDLQRLQCRVLTASSSGMAKAFLKAFRIDLVVCGSKVRLGGPDYVALTYGPRVPLLRAMDSSIIGNLIERTFAWERL